MRIRAVVSPHRAGLPSLVTRRIHPDKPARSVEFSGRVTALLAGRITGKQNLER